MLSSLITIIFLYSTLYRYETNLYILFNFFGSFIFPNKSIIAFSYIYATSPKNLLIKYCCPFPVTLVVLLILTEPSGLFTVLSFTSNNPISILRCVGIFQSEPRRLIRYQFSRIQANNLFCPMSTPFCFSNFAKSPISMDV